MSAVKIPEGLIHEFEVDTAQEPHRAVLVDDVPQVVRGVVTDLIQAFVIREEFMRACGWDDQRRGVRECITHLQDYMACIDREDAS